ncbi:MAG: hypothetical protein HF974_00705 [ANME-2 cluster archaeon]|nr:hypothetical protein [ANME-2 cluster archaeon]
MMKKNYLIYLDILGFENLAEVISEKKGIESRKIRQDFINVIKERVESIEEKGKIIGKHYGKKDDWILVTDTIDNAFSVIYDILNHNTGYKDYERIPFEIAVGTGEFDNWARFEGEKLIVENEIIKFLKSYIVDYYRKWYKKNNDDQKIKSTFLIFTETAYEELDPLDKKKCQQISYDDNKVEVVFFAFNVDKISQIGKTFEFLEKIEYVGNIWYGRIDELYVPPIGFEDIANTLKEKRIVFITGTQEIGKTYTAVMLLWIYYKNGYEPKWIKGGEFVERVQVRKALENIRKELKPGCVLYFENPFGKTKYERREGLEREIWAIIDSVEHVKDVYVIITSREEIFKEFEKEKLSVRNLRDFENKLNIKKPSYDYERRSQIILKYAEEMKCKWYEDDKLKEFVLESIKHENILPTPLSMRDFAGATTNVKKEKEIIIKLEEKSNETAKAFTREIENMTNDKILFLSFPFISRYFEIPFVKAMYEDLVRELGLKEVWNFDTVFNWFKDDKINIKNKYIEFSHSSYSEALKYLLIEHNIYNELFIKILDKLSERDESAIHIALFIRDNFDILPENSRHELLLQLSEKKVCSQAIILALAENCHKISANLRNELFSKLIKKGVIRKLNVEDCSEEFECGDARIDKIPLSYYFENQEHTKAKVYCVEDKDKICSLIQFYEKKSYGYNELFLDIIASSQGETGYAQSLLKLILGIMFYDKFDFISGYIFDNKELIEMYQSIGFNIIETVEDPLYGTFHKIVLVNENKNNKESVIETIRDSI